jgi:hypothetical protein
MIVRFLMAMVFAISLFGESSGETTVEQRFRKIDLGNRKVARLGVFGRLRANCTTASLPKIRVSKPPQKGMIAVREAVVRLKGSNPCTGRKVRLMLVLYQRYPGTWTDDFVMFSVTFSNKTVEHNVSIKTENKRENLLEKDDAIEL